jgi:hypothetical protein
VVRAGGVSGIGLRLPAALAAAVALLLACVAMPARADDSRAPWAGGPAVETAFEAYASQLAAAVAGRPVRVVCNDQAGWAGLSRRYAFAPGDVWGFVLFGATTDPSVPADEMELAEAPCRYLDEYWHAPAREKGKICRFIRAPFTGVCPAYRLRVLALQTISHESQHLSGIRDEATAECNGLQKLAWFAEQLGASPEQGRVMARDYYRDVYLGIRRGTPYFRSDCPDPGGG